MIDHYRGHESKPTAVYLRELQAATGGAPGSVADTLSKIDAIIADSRRAVDAYIAKVDDVLAKVADLESALGGADLSKSEGIDAVVDAFFDMPYIRASIAQLKASANPFSDQHGRPENMSPAKWAARRTI